MEGEALDEGHNVVNFCTEIAMALGCNPIVFVGLDLAFTDLKSYAKGVVDNPTVEKEDITHTEQFESDAVEWPDIYGNKVFTLWKWIAESEWLAKLATTHPEITMINATEGGIGFAGIPNKELATLSFNKSYPLEKMVKDAIQGATLPQVTPEKVKEVMTELETSLLACKKQLEILLEENEEIEKRLQASEQLESLHTGRSALAISDLEEEVAFGAVLEVFNSIQVFVQQGALQAIKKEQDPITRLLKMVKLQEERYQFLLHVIEANLILLHETFEE